MQDTQLLKKEFMTLLNSLPIESLKMLIEFARFLHAKMQISSTPYTPSNDDWSEEEWLQMGTNNPAFNFLHDETEDIYTLVDGEPFHAEI